MFNFKKIGITPGILGMVGLTGALMAGTAFAGKGGKGNDNGKTDSGHRVDMCHFNEEIEYNVAGDPTSGTLEAVGWYLKDFDADSQLKHEINHDDTTTNDFEILFESELVSDGVMNSADDCMGLSLFIGDYRGLD